MGIVSLDELNFLGRNLSRPECVLTARSGDLFVSDSRGGVSKIASDGSETLYKGRNAPEGFMPNGIALLKDRSFLIANLGPTGGVYHLAQDGTLTARLLEVNGKTLPPTNFVSLDRQGRIWVTASTWKIPRELSMFKGHADGFIAVIDDKGARIVAEGIGFTNEAIVDPTEEWLYVNETMAQRTSRFPIRADGSLGDKELVAAYGSATFPDGLTFDAEGGVWIVSVASNRLIRTAPDGSQETFLEDADPAMLDEVARKFDAGECARPLIDSGGERKFGNLASVAFGGEDLRTMYLGTLFRSDVIHFRSDFRGAEPVHWNF